MSKEIKLTLIGKPGCHLCEEAESAIADVFKSLTEDKSLLNGATLALERLSILDDENLLQQYHDEIPVLLIDGQVHNYWRIDPTRLRQALIGAAK